MFNGIHQHFPVHNVDVQVLPAFDGRFMVEISVQQTDQVSFTYPFVFAQRLRHN
ncbi:hypothetical protein D3C87_2025230 [compost metagenome]